MTRPDQIARRSAVRAFVRTHHPDVGGDPQVFTAGLRRLRESGGATSSTTGAVADDDPRLNVPVTIVTIVTTRSRALTFLIRLGRRIRLTQAARRRIDKRSNPR